LQSNISYQAAEVYKRLSEQGYRSIDPTMIMALIQTLLACWQNRHSSDPAQARIEFERRYEKHPKRMKRRISEHVLFEAHKKGQTLTPAEASVLADSMIAQILSTDQETAAACCMEAGVEELD
jgi:hypothetical protein